MMRKTSLGGGGDRSGRDVGSSSGLGGGDRSGGDVASSNGSGGGGGGDVGDSSSLGGEIFVKYPPSLSGPPLDPQSHNISGGLRQQLATLIEQQKCLSQLLVERNVASPFLREFPHTYRLLDEEISRVTSLFENTLRESWTEQPSPLASGGIFQNVGANMNRWPSQIPPERSVSSSAAPNSLNAPGSSSSTAPNSLNAPGSSSFPAPNSLNAPGSSSSPAPNSLNARGSSSSPVPNSLNAPCSASYPAPNSLNAPGSSSGPIVKRSIKVDLPADKYPKWHFVPPLKNILKQLEASTNCRLTLRGIFSMESPIEEEKKRYTPGYEHLIEPLHILIEAELPIEIVDSHLEKARELLSTIGLLTPLPPREGRS